MSFNTFGKLFRFTTWGESHGPAIGCVVDGCPPNINISEKDVQVELNKRRPGQSKFVTQRKEKDLVQILSGVFSLIIFKASSPVSVEKTLKPSRSKLYLIKVTIDFSSSTSKIFADILIRFRSISLNFFTLY